MRSAILGFVAGICWLQTQAALPPALILGSLLTCGILLALAARAVQRNFIKLPLLAGAGALLGFAWAALFAQHYLAQELPRELEGCGHTAVGSLCVQIYQPNEVTGVSGVTDAHERRRGRDWCGQAGWVASR